MRCHYIYDKEIGKVHIPGCWGSVIHGPDHCSCYPKKEPSEESKDREMIRELEKENARLNRIIKKLLKHAK